MTNTAVATMPRLSLVEKFATRYSVEPTKMLSTLKATAFKVYVGKDISLSVAIRKDVHI